MYSASVVESAVVSCLELFQLKAPPFRQNTYPACDLLSEKSLQYISKLATMEEIESLSLTKENMPRRPATNYIPISMVVPLARWGIDLVGALPKSRKHARWVVVAIDYLTKWVEVKPLSRITEQQMMKFIGTNILCRFGVPEQKVTDNGTLFEGRKFTQFLKTWGIQHGKASVAYPQDNGQEENANHIVLDGIKKKLQAKGSSWVDELPRILWAYRTTPRRATTDTPFGLAYGFEARALVEAVLHTWREQQYDPHGNEENQGIELNFVEERRVEARIWPKNYKKQVKYYFDKRVKPKAFQEAWLQRPNEWYVRQDCASSGTGKCHGDQKKPPQQHLRGTSQRNNPTTMTLLSAIFLAN
ncbi:unnamed protein product [Cuscuta campestris]|uniref:Integrase catalytic domain-containing protein n=1 Tax=Cuscuta campestris TaxID=132261 RepID=A0A484LWT9_9ASTE|nr:unnamed protein product [Cuscuta campestris]